jgi:hypothetical protein
LADEARLDVGQPEIIGPLIGADRDRMAAAVIGAIDQETANAPAVRISAKVIFWRMGSGMSAFKAPGRSGTSRERKSGKPNLSVCHFGKIPS